jgi:hypothetical protein
LIKPKKQPMMNFKSVEIVSDIKNPLFTG